MAWPIGGRHGPDGSPGGRASRRTHGRNPVCPRPHVLDDAPPSLGDLVATRDESPRSNAFAGTDRGTRCPRGKATAGGVPDGHGQRRAAGQSAGADRLARVGGAVKTSAALIGARAGPGLTVRTVLAEIDSVGGRQRALAPSMVTAAASRCGIESGCGSGSLVSGYRCGRHSLRRCGHDRDAGLTRHALRVGGSCRCGR